MFIKRVIRGNKSYYYIVRSIRIEGKVRHEIIRYIGTIENLLNLLEKIK